MQLQRLVRFPSSQTTIVDNLLMEKLFRREVLIFDIAQGGPAAVRQDFA